MPENFQMLKYFLECYWNEMGDLVEGDIRGAARSFRAAGIDYVISLKSDIEQGLISGLISDDFNWDTYKGGFWSSFHRHINCEDAAIVLQELQKEIDAHPFN